MIRNPRLLGSDWLHSGGIRTLVPARLRALMKRHISFADYRSEQLRREAERRFGGPIPTGSDFASSHDPVVGIFADSSFTFSYNVAACRDLRVPFRVVDLAASDWVKGVLESGCSAFLAAPGNLLGIWRRMFEERLWVASQDLGKRLYPSFSELFLWESKRRMHDWLVARNVPHPRTWVFYCKQDALEFCTGATYPVVCKTDSGAASSGVFLLRNRRAAERMVRLAFGKGILGRSADARERAWGSILLQEYVPHDFEWRIVRIGDDYLCRRKVRVGDFASGSGEIGWAKPLPGMLDFARWVTDIGGFRHMAVDLFVSEGGGSDRRFLVNELQAIVGFRDVAETEHTGRWRRETGGCQWSFETGSFHQNACANLRLRMLLEAEKGL